MLSFSPSSSNARFDALTLEALLRNKAWQDSNLKEWWLPHNGELLRITKTSNSREYKIDWINKEQSYTNDKIVPFETAKCLMESTDLIHDPDDEQFANLPTTEVVEHMRLLEQLIPLFENYPGDVELTLSSYKKIDTDNSTHNLIFDAALNQLRVLLPWMGPLIDSVHIVVPQERRRAHLKKVLGNSELLEALGDDPKGHGLMEPWYQTSVWLTHWAEVLPKENALYKLDDTHFLIYDIAADNYLHHLSVKDKYHASIKIRDAYNSPTYDTHNKDFFQTRPNTITQWNVCMTKDVTPVFTSTSQRLPQRCDQVKATQLATQWICKNELDIPSEVNDYYCLDADLHHWALTQWSSQNQEQAQIISSLVGDLPKELTLGFSPQEDSSTVLKAWGVAAKGCIEATASSLMLPTIFEDTDQPTDNQSPGL